MRSMFVSAAVAAAIAVPAAASTITAADFTDNSATSGGSFWSAAVTSSVGGAANPDWFNNYERSGVDLLGINSTGNREDDGTEIDRAVGGVETFAITFTEGLTVTELTLAQLYSAPMEEVVIDVTYTDGSLGEFRFRGNGAFNGPAGAAYGPLNADITLVNPGTFEVRLLELSTDRAGGLFGGNVLSMEFRASNLNDTSFAFVSTTAVPVPTAATAGLAGLGLLGFRRRR